MPSETSPSGPIPDPAGIEDAAATFGLLSATVRLELLWLLGEDDHDVGSLADAVGQSLATVSHHLAKLKLAGLVSSRRDGRRKIYGIDDPTIVELVRLAVAHRHELRHIAPSRSSRRGA